MEWIRGRDLLAHAQMEKLDTRGRTEPFARLVEAVSHAHEHGISHRDLKPDNVLVASETGQPKLLDFGIAAMEKMAGSASATLEGDLLGTVAYMAPEQARRSVDSLGPHTDVYSLGPSLSNCWLTGPCDRWQASPSRRRSARWPSVRLLASEHREWTFHGI